MFIAHHWARGHFSSFYSGDFFVVLKVRIHLHIFKLDQPWTQIITYTYIYKMLQHEVFNHNISPRNSKVHDPKLTPPKKSTFSSIFHVFLLSHHVSSKLPLQDLDIELEARPGIFEAFGADAEGHLGVSELVCLGRGMADLRWNKSMGNKNETGC